MTAQLKLVPASPQWQKEDAFVASKHLLDGGYHTIMIAPFNCGMAEAGKVPAKCLSNGEWDLRTGWHDAGDKPKHKNLLSFGGKHIPNYGIVTGSRMTRKGRPAIFAALDIDCLAPELVEALKAEFGESFRVRYGRPVQERSGLIPLILLLESEDAIGREKYTRNKTDDIQLLRERKQFVAAGVHPRTGALYEWFDGNGPADILPVKQLPVVELTRLTFLLAQHGFRPPAADKGEVAKGRLDQLLAELDGEDEQAEYDSLFGDEGKYPLRDLIDNNNAFAALYRRPSDDHSGNRLAVAKDSIRRWPKISVCDYRVFCFEWSGAGTYDDKAGRGVFDNRQIARQFSKAEADIAAEKDGKSTPHESVMSGVGAATDGSAFTAANDDDRDEDRNAVLPAKTTPTKTTASETPPPKPDFKYLQQVASGNERLRRDWVVKHFLARHTTAILLGRWGHGKTAGAVEIGLHVAAGVPWRDRAVKKGVVVHVALENPQDVEMRIAAQRDQMESDGIAMDDAAHVIYTSTGVLWKADATATKDEAKIIKVAIDASKHYGVDVALVIIDTLSQSMRGGDGSSEKDAGNFTTALQRISAATGACTLALAHPTKAGTGGVRGSGAFEADVDCIIEMVYDASAKRGTIKAGSKFRIGNPSKVDFGYRLKSAHIGVDEDGEDETVVLSVDAASSGAAMGDGFSDEDAVLSHNEPDSLAARSQMVLSIFKELADADKADDEGASDARASVRLSTSDIVSRFNQARKREKLTALSRPTIHRDLKRMVEGKRLAMVGEGRTSAYLLPPRRRLN